MGVADDRIGLALNFWFNFCVAIAKLIVAFALIVPAPAFSVGIPPWHFGMSREQVKSFGQFGPYKGFKNGDLETFSGRLHGQKQNVQFFFANNRLTRIGVYLGEGTDRDKAIATFRQAYDRLEKAYGKVTIPEVHVTGKSEPVNADVLAIAAAANAFVTGSTHIVPIKQPKDMRVSGAIMSYYVGSAKWFAVAIFFDPR